MYSNARDLTDFGGKGMKFESLLERAERHVAEGAERISKLERLIGELYQDGHGNLVPEARLLLHDLEAAQSAAVEHLGMIRTNKSESRATSSSGCE
jgi:hypothetical protein